MTDFNVIKSLYQIDGCGIKHDVIEKTERRLCCQLPKVFKDFYQQFGLSENINNSFNHILSLDGIGFKDDYLILAKEHQSVCFWGIKKLDLNQDNPKVYVCYDIDDKKPTWHLENDTLDKFFIMTSLFNGTMGGLAYHANTLNKLSANHSVIKMVIDDWQEMPNFQDNGTRYFIKDNKAIMIFCMGDDGCDGVFLGANDQALFDEILALDMDWSYVSYEDENFDE